MIHEKTLKQKSRDTVTFLKQKTRETVPLNGGEKNANHLRLKFILSPLGTKKQENPFLSDTSSIFDLGCLSIYCMMC